MDLNRLRTFQHVVREGGFTAAARRLGLSQPSVSLQVKALEESLGRRLLERSSRRVSLTPDGEMLFEMAQRLFAIEATIADTFADRRRQEPEQLTVATNQSVAAHLLPPRLSTYQKRFPHVELNIHNMSTGEIVSAVRDGGTQIGIILIDPEIQGLVAKPVVPYEMVLVTPRGHPLSQRRQVALEDIAEYPFVSYTRDTETRRLIDQPFQARGMSTSISMALGSTDLIIKYVSLGYGISIIHNLNIDEANRENLFIRPLERHYSRQHIHLIYRASVELSPAAQAFCDLF